MDKELVDKATAGLGKAKTDARGKKFRMMISPTDNSGFHVEHEEVEGGAPTGKKASHVYEKIDGVHKHIDTHWGKVGSGWENNRSDKEAIPMGEEQPGGAKTAAESKKD